MHKKKFVSWGLQPPLEDRTPSPNTLVSVWIPERILKDWESLPEKERHEIGRQITYTISNLVFQATWKRKDKNELLRTGD